MRSLARQRVVLGLLSVAGMAGLYALAANALGRPGVLPPVPALLSTFTTLLTGGMPAHGDGHVHPSDHIGFLVQGDVTLQGALLVSALRVLFGVGVGGLLGVGLGVAMGWSRKVDEYVHPIYVLLRSIPPLALITYVMLWFGHGEAHRLVPIVYAVFTTVVIPTYHGVRDLADVYVKAARALGAGAPLLLAKVVLPAASPFVLSGLRYALIVAWMTTVGVEMLMGDDGIGHLLVDGGLWSSRLEIRVDPAVVIVGILGLGTAGYLMDAAARMIGDRLTFWRKGRPT